MLLLVVWLLAADPEDPSVRQLAAVKCNLAGKSAGFAFREQSADRHEVNQWAHKLGMVIPDNLPDYLFRKLEVAESQTVSAEDLLKGILETTGGSAEKWTCRARPKARALPRGLWRCVKPA